jgi:hypothetical protein
MSGDIDKSVPIPEQKETSRKWFGDDDPNRNKILRFTGEWHGDELPPPILSDDDISKINDMIADGKDPKIVMKPAKKESPAKTTDPLDIALLSLNMKRKDGGFIKNEHLDEE